MQHTLMNTKPVLKIQEFYIDCKERQKEKESTAAEINNLLRQAQQNNWGEAYINALEDVKKLLKIKNTYLELIVSPQICSSGEVVAE